MLVVRPGSKSPITEITSKTGAYAVKFKIDSQVSDPDEMMHVISKPYSFGTSPDTSKDNPLITAVPFGAI
jgi:hypothetical protein